SAREALDYAQKLSSHSVEVQLVNARWLLANKQTAPAQAVYDQLLATSPAPNRVLAQMASDYSAAGQSRIAAARIAASISHRTPDAAAYRILAELLLDDHQSAEAHDAAARAAQLDPQGWESHFVLARSLVAVAKDSEAAQEFELTMRLNPKAWAVA